MSDLVDGAMVEDLLSEIGLGTVPEGPPVTKEPMYIRDLTAEDISSLSRRAAYGSQQGGLIQKLRAPHHTLARLLAEGKKHPECAIVTGYGVEYICMLERDPAFQELVAYYKENVAAAYVNVHERLAALGTIAMEELLERLSDAEQVKKMTPGALREIMNDALDRSVAPSKVNQGNAMGGASGAPKAITINFVSPPVARETPVAREPQRASIGHSGAPAMIDITPNPQEKSGA